MPMTSLNRLAFGLFAHNLFLIHCRYFHQYTLDPLPTTADISFLLLTLLQTQQIDGILLCLDDDFLFTLLNNSLSINKLH